MIQLTIRITGDKATIKRLTRLGHSLMDFRSAMGQIGSEVRKYVQNNVFASQGGSIGHVWPALAASTIKQKLQYYPTYATTPLIRTGTMQRNFVSSAGLRSVRISNRSPQFPYHNSTAPRTKIPYRPMLLISDDIARIARTIVHKDIEKKIRTA